MIKPETIEIDDLNQFVKILSGWHNQKVKVLEHMMTIPDGTEMESDGKTVVLAGDTLAGFKAGIVLSLMELGKLPFGYEQEPEDAAV